MMEIYKYRNVVLKIVVVSFRKLKAYGVGGKCFLNVRLMCTKIRVVFDMCKMFDKNIFHRYFISPISSCIIDV